MSVNYIDLYFFVFLFCLASLIYTYIIYTSMVSDGERFLLNGLLVILILPILLIIFLR